MTALLFVLVIGVVAVAITVDIAALILFLKHRGKS